VSWKNQLYFGDNLEVLRESIPAESVDLIYLDPPFNSKANYNVLFKTPKGIESSAQITAFEDTWHWGEEAQKEFGELIHQANTDVSEMIQALRRFLGENDMMAYLVMMANRLLELHRILKHAGSLYLHCDVTASHYLKIVLDGVFGKENFRNEITWKRTTAHNDSARYGANTDIIFFYTKSETYTFNPAYQPYTEEYKARFGHKDPDGRVWTDDNLTAKGLSGGGYEYEYKGYTSLWRCPLSTMERLDKENKLYFTKTGGIRLKRYLDELPGIPSQALWDDIFPINSQSRERMHYPTQKPLQLLERIIKVSSNEGDVVLDPFCGCGTAVHAAEKLKRKWIGIDITHLAISLIENRLKDAFPGIEFDILGTPKDLEGAGNLAERNKYQFQWWACSLVNAQPYQGKKKGADSGIDGLIFFQDDHRGGIPKKIIVSVKGGDNVGVAMIRDLGHVIDREKASIGLFITLVEPTRPMKEEAIKAGYFETLGSNFPKIQILTIKGLLDGTERAKYPDLMQGGLTFKKATVDDKTQQDTLF
jgi:adenine specific DNA methylase Mod